MKLDRVTITGADDSVTPMEMFELSEQYPYLEWGILVDCGRVRPRFPSNVWFHNLQAFAIGRKNFQLSLHLCGNLLDYLLLGSLAHIPSMMDEGLRRIQLNFHGEPTKVDLPAFIRALSGFESKPQFIFQIDGVDGQRLISEVEGEGRHSFSTVPLFDMSHGEGKSPDKWPVPFDHDTYHGYAGGLGPDNLHIEIPRIARAVGECRIWIDMETKVRSADGGALDLEKVARCLEIAKPFVFPYYQHWREIMGFEPAYVPSDKEAEYRYNAMVNHATESGMIDRLNHAYRECKKECHFV